MTSGFHELKKAFQEIEAIVVKCVREIKLSVEECILEKSSKSLLGQICCCGTLTGL